jgi:hypothetical protein
MGNENMPASSPLVGEETVDVPIRGSLRELTRVREKVRLLLAGYPESVVADAVQIADELASHGFRHGAPPRMVRLALIRAGARVRIEVEEAVATPTPRGCCSQCRLGEAVLNTLATCWDAHDTIRWAELGLPARTSGA